MAVFDSIKKKLLGGDEPSAEYLEVNTSNATSAEGGKVVIKTFALKTYEDINPILNALREGYAISVIDIKALKSKDIVELKRVISKIKKTVEAVEGNIAGFGENIIITTPSFAKIERGELDTRSQPTKQDSGLETF